MPSTWTVAEPSLPALTFTYSFGPGMADALAFPVEGGVAVVSPPWEPAESVSPIWRSTARSAPSSRRTPSITWASPAWKARYPEAAVFAPPSPSRGSRRTAELTGVRPLAEAAKLPGDKVELVDMPHYKTGEALVRWKIDGGWAWYLTDVMLTSPRRRRGPSGWS